MKCNPSEYGHFFSFKHTHIH